PVSSVSVDWASAKTAPNVPASRYHRGNPSSRTAARRTPNARRNRAENRTNTIRRNNPPAKLNSAAASPSSRRRPSSPLTRAWTGTTMPTTTATTSEPHHPERSRPGPPRPKPRTVVHLVILPSFPLPTRQQPTDQGNHTPAGRAGQIAEWGRRRPDPWPKPATAPTPRPGYTRKRRRSP